ncbi:MAG: hypothetical protein ACTSYL_05315 [Candidatus Thorarchaeota archaeon]
MSKPDLTQARVMKVQTGTVITLPEEFVEGIKKPYSLVILVKKDGNVKIYPVDTDQVLYLKLEIEKLSKSFLEDLTGVFNEGGLEDILFTSGICQTKSQCYYECYFPPKQLLLTKDEFEKRLRAISGVQKVILEYVPTT